jgi:hypothetical protein
MREPREDIRPTLGRWAVTLAVIAVGFVPIAYALVALVLAIGGPSESSDALAELLGRAVAYAGIAMAVGAFLCAIASRMRREPVDSLWFPLALLPVLVALAFLIYIFWVR